MQTKTKIIIGVFSVIILVIVGVVINIKDFNTIQTEEKQTPNSSKTEVKKEQKPKLELTQESVELEVGANFEYKDFIKVAEDSQGYNLKDKVTADKNIPTDVAGEYKITYKLELANGKSIGKELILYIIDPRISENPD